MVIWCYLCGFAERWRYIHSILIGSIDNQQKLVWMWTGMGNASVSNILFRLERMFRRSMPGKLKPGIFVFFYQAILRTVHWSRCLQVSRSFDKVVLILMERTLAHAIGTFYNVKALHVMLFVRLSNLDTIDESLFLLADFYLMVATVLISTSVCEIASIAVKMLRKVFSYPFTTQVRLTWLPYNLSRGHSDPANSDWHRI